MIYQATLVYGNEIRTGRAETDDDAIKVALAKFSTLAGHPDVRPFETAVVVSHVYGDKVVTSYSCSLGQYYVATR